MEKWKLMKSRRIRSQIAGVSNLSNLKNEHVPLGDGLGDIAVTSDGTKLYVANWQGNNVSIIDTAINNVTSTVTAGKYTINYPTGVAIGPFTDSNVTDQSTRAISDATEGAGVEETNLSLAEGKKAVELNNSNNNNYESDNNSNSSGNESSKNNSTPGFGLLGGLTSLYGGWKLRKN